MKERNRFNPNYRPLIRIAVIFLKVDAKISRGDFHLNVIKNGSGRWFDNRFKPLEKIAK